jgi:hypothetical protein
MGFVRAREILGVAALLALGCDSLATIEVERRSMAILPADEMVGEIDLGEFRNEEDITEDDIAGARITSVVLEVVDPEDGDLEFADRVEVYIDAPGLERRLIAAQERFPAGESRVALRPEPVELEPYVLADRLHFTAIIDGEAPDEDMLVQATARLDVGVTAEGACNAM